MPAINVEYINPLLAATVKVIGEACSMQVAIGKPFVSETVFSDEELLILMGITGEMKGQVIFDFPSANALNVASHMCSMQLPELDDLAKSAICELGNMILGNTATLFSTKGIAIDITPPTVCMGNVTFNATYAANICIPILFENNKLFNINIAIKED